MFRKPKEVIIDGIIIISDFKVLFTLVLISYIFIKEDYQTVLHFICFVYFLLAVFGGVLKKSLE